MLNRQEYPLGAKVNSDGFSSKTKYCSASEKIRWCIGSGKKNILSHGNLNFSARCFCPWTGD